MKKLFLLVILYTAIAVAAFAAADTTRVLFIGNSFTYTYNVPGLVQGLASASGLPFKFVMYAPGGATVGDTSQGTNAHMNNPAVFDLIRSDNWDFVSLQDNQGRFVLGNCTFPSTVAYKIVEGHIKIKDSVKYYHPCAHMLWFAGWAFKDGYPGISPTGEGLINNIYSDYKCLQDTAGGIISPIGIAWERAMVALPQVNLWGPDNSHQSLAGSYLTASVIFTTIFKQNASAVLYNGGLDSATARTIRRIAYQVVMDSMVTTHLSDFTPQLTYNGTMLTATSGFVDYEWFQNGNSIATGSANMISNPVPANYQLIATDSNGCRQRAAMFSIWPASVPSLANTGESIRVYPNPAGEEITLETGAADNNGVDLFITDITGRVVRTTPISAMKTHISLEGLNSGIYFVTVRTSKTVSRTAITKK